MKVIIEKDEWWPVYDAEVLKDDAPEWMKNKYSSELTEAEWADYQRVNKEFEDWQKKLQGLYRE